MLLLVIVERPEKMQKHQCELADDECPVYTCRHTQIEESKVSGKSRALLCVALPFV